MKGNLKMKRLIAIFLSFIMIAASCAVSYAEEDMTGEQSGVSVVRKMANSDTETLDELSYSEIEAILENQDNNDNFTFDEPSVVGLNPFEPYSIIGDDDRTVVSSTTSHPYSAIGMIKTVWPDLHSSIGTAFLIANKVAVTAAHCIYDSNHGGWPLSIRFYPGKNGATFLNEPFGYAYAVEYAVSSIYRQCNDLNESSTDNDWGLLGFVHNFGTSTGVLNYGCYSDSTILNSTLEIVGYSGATDFHMYRACGNALYCNTNTISHQVDTESGTSGGPIFNTTTRTVYGLQVVGGGSALNVNIGVRITEEMCAYFSTFMEDHI